MALYNRLLSVDEVLEQLCACLKHKKPYSLVRFGHGEMHVVSHKICPEHKINLYFDHYHKYAGISELNDKIAINLINALKKANLVGLGDHTPYNQELLDKIIEYYNLSLPSICSAWIPVDMINSKSFFDLLKLKKIIIVGRRSAEGADKFRDLGINVIGTMTHQGFEEMSKTINRICAIPDFDIAIVAAGVPATIMCPEISQKSGKIAIDFGHALDILIEGEKFDHEKRVNDFNAALQKEVNES